MEESGLCSHHGLTVVPHGVDTHMTFHDTQDGRSECVEGHANLLRCRKRSTAPTGRFVSLHGGSCILTSPCHSVALNTGNVSSQCWLLTKQWTSFFQSLPQLCPAWGMCARVSTLAAEATRWPSVQVTWSIGKETVKGPNSRLEGGLVKGMENNRKHSPYPAWSNQHTPHTHWPTMGAQLIGFS
jgi:hypothetical protein